MKRFSSAYAPAVGGACAASFILTLTISCLANSAQAANYAFDVLYAGNQVATLAAGSDDPDSTTLQPGDTFLWTIAAQDGAFWQVDVGGNFFPLMAFAAGPEGERTGSFELQLLSNGLDAFNFNDTNVLTSEVHVGTNSVALPTGLIFDEMRLDFLLTDAHELTDSAPDANDLQPADTILSGLLPVFGAPEYSRGISYIVPEPSSLLLALTGLIGLTVGARRRG